jgi:hypothetical protein
MQWIKIKLRYYNDASEEDRQYLYMLSVKTQYAGMEIHILIIRILKYISKKYFQYLSVDDEGMYWGTSDENILKDKFNQYTALINSVSNAMQSIPIQPGENLEDYFKRILKP